MASPVSFSCVICESPRLDEIEGFAALTRVTSDCKPWPAGGRLAVCLQCGAVQKMPDATWIEEIGRIYEEFDVYHQGGGKDPAVFTAAGGQNQSRSERLVAYVKEVVGLPETGRMLDFGCGNGIMLQNFANSYPGWSLNGAELSDKTEPLLRRIAGFDKLYTCPITDLPGEFDLVMLIHALEHLLDPVRALRELSGKVPTGGHLFIEVVDGNENPYDLLIADHLLHFTRATLDYACRRGGFEPLPELRTVIRKELTWVGRRAGAAAAPGVPDMPLAPTGLARRHVAWLSTQAASFQELARKMPHFGIFGTSISGTWLQAQIGGSASFFVDEDPNRAGRNIAGKPIVPPGELPQDSDIFIPLPYQLAREIADRLTRPGVRFHLPPSYS